MSGTIIVHGPATVYFIPTNPFVPWFVSKNNSLIDAPPVTFGTNVFHPMAPYESVVTQAVPSPPTGPPKAAQTASPDDVAALAALALPTLAPTGIGPTSISCDPFGLSAKKRSELQSCMDKYHAASQDLLKILNAQAEQYTSAAHQLTVARLAFANLKSPASVTYDEYRAQVRSDVMPQIGEALREMSQIRALPTDQVKQIDGGLRKLLALARQHAKANAAQISTLTGDRQALQRFLPDANYVKTYDTGLDLIDTTFIPALTALTPDRFAFSDTEDCHGTFSGGRVTTYILGEENGSTQTVMVVCRPRIFMSSGFIFSSLPQQTFAGVPVNPASLTAPSPAPGASPAAAPTPFSTIERDTASDVRPIPIVMANVNLFGDQYDDTFPGSLYASFGVAIGSGTNSTVLDYAGGLSYGLSRTLLFTLGAHLGQVNELAPGYQVGDVIPQGTAPETVTRSRVGYFIGVTFGKQP